MLLLNNNYIASDYDKIFAVSVRSILAGILELDYKYASEREYIPVIDNKKQFGMVLIKREINNE